MKSGNYESFDQECDQWKLLSVAQLPKESDAFGRGSRVWQVPSFTRCLNTKEVNGEWLQECMGRSHGQLGLSDRFLLKFTVVLKSNRSLCIHVYAWLNPDFGILQL